MNGIFAKNGDGLSEETRDILKQLRARRITVDEAESSIMGLASNLDTLLELAFGGINDISNEAEQVYHNL